MVLLLDSGRFETFIDAIFAIMMTIMVIKIPQPETLSFSGLMESSVMYLSYLISFIIIASIWNNHRKLFDRIKDIDNVVIAIYMVLTLAVTFVPYFTLWVSEYPYSLVPELCYGLLFVITNILYMLASHIAVTRDNYNYNNNNLDAFRYVRLNVLIYLVFIVGFILGIFINPIAILIACLVTAIIWNLPFKYLNTCEKGDADGH